MLWSGAVLRPNWEYMRKFGFRKSCEIFIRNVRHHWSFYVIIKPLLILLTIMFNMIALNMLRLTDISSKKDLTIEHMHLVHPLLMFLPRGFSNQTLTFVLASWASLIIHPNLREVLESFHYFLNIFLIRILEYLWKDYENVFLIS